MMCLRVIMYFGYAIVSFTIHYNIQGVYVCYHNLILVHRLQSFIGVIISQPDQDGIYNTTECNIQLIGFEIHNSVIFFSSSITFPWPKNSNTRCIDKTSRGRHRGKQTNTALHSVFHCFANISKLFEQRREYPFLFYLSSLFFFLKYELFLLFPPSSPLSHENYISTP